ncbi:hypothetical protein MPER_01099 [Moniliophthora perniciosa FA553]|nr:hypothetical protein MPER_01099 [Moniliophthora perniciosa FA553]
MVSTPSYATRPSYTTTDSRAMAIVGISISAPGGIDEGLDTEEFYEFLKSRGSGIVTVPKDRWNAEAYHGTQPGKIVTTKGGYIPNATYGRSQEFGITPAEAAQMLCSQTRSSPRLHALQRSGVDYRSTNTCVYVGCTVVHHSTL